MKNIAMLIKPSSSSCNLQCEYCFYHSTSTKRKEQNKGYMTEKTMRAVIDRVFENQPDNVSFCFQGGEPAVIGLEYYKKFVQYVNEVNTRNVKIEYSIQTNGILLNTDWCNFIKQNNFMVGISLDGTEEVHNKYRYHNNGGFTRILTAINMLKSFNIDFMILSVVTKDFAKDIKNIYELYKHYGFNNLHFIPSVVEFGRTDAEFAINAEEYGEFLVKLFDMWYEDYKKCHFIHIRYFDNVVKALNCYQPKMCGMQGKCSIQYVIEADGSVYPCDFYCYDEYQIGNINEMGLQDIFNSENAQKFLKKSLNTNEECVRCKFFPLCKGGCRRDRQTQLDGDAGKNKYCEAYKKFFAHIIQELSR